MYLINLILLMCLTVLNFYKFKKINNAFLLCVEWALISLFVLIFNLPYNGIINLFVFLFCLCFSLPYLFFKSNEYTKKESSKQTEYSGIKETSYIKMNKLVITLGIIGLLYLAVYLGFRVNHFFNINSLMSKMNSISHMRYSLDESNLPILNRIINIFTYTFCAYDGFFALKKISKINILNLVILLVQTILLNTKATIVFGVGFWFGGYFTACCFYRIRFSVKKILNLILVIIFLLLFTAGIDYLRHKGIFSFYEEIKKILVSYLIGPYSALCVLYEKGINLSLELGINTFTSIFKLLGITEHTHGMFVYVDSMQTNVFSIFKHLIMDFSYIGSIIFSFVIGLINVYIDRTMNQKNHLLGVPISMVICSVILTSFFSSMFRYSVNLFACIFIILLPLISKITVGGKHIV